jgi:hypothetical protein
VEFVNRHPDASVFHAPEWLQALRLTYGYEPVGFTTSSPHECLENGVVVCRINSWLTGRRMVSLPFSDHCQPLVNEHHAKTLMAALIEELTANKSSYVEIRPVTVSESVQADYKRTRTHFFHRLDLRPNLDEIFRGFHKDCIQRKIRRAEREGLVCEQGRSEQLLQKFYELLVETRRRHGAPPQPLTWFGNLIRCMGRMLKIWVASKDGRPVASILTLQHKNTMTYKYGGSARDFNKLGGMQLLLWKAISEARMSRLLEFDMGRSDWGNEGLVNFKRRWGTAEATLQYIRYDRRRPSVAGSILTSRFAKGLVAYLHESVVGSLAKHLYRHLGSVLVTLRCVQELMSVARTTAA